MGCDGGTIPTRDELVKTKKKPEQKDKDSVRLYKWQHCHLSQQKLTRPIVACELGFMYNKEVIIEKLLDSKANKDAASTSQSNNAVGSHIKSLKDVRELELTDNPAFKRRPGGKESASVGDGGYNDRLGSPYVCPIAGLEMNGKFRFVFDWKKGRALSERGHKIVMKNDPEMKIPEENLIIINPDTNEEAELMVDKMKARRAEAKAAKAAKKASKRKLDEVAEQPPSTSFKGPKASKADCPPPSSKTNGISNGNSNGTKSKTTAKNLQSDPNKSEVYKSLFNSHKSAVNKPKGHWVTFDPRYN